MKVGKQTGLFPLIYAARLDYLKCIRLIGRLLSFDRIPFFLMT